MAESSPPEKITCMVWLKSFTPLEVLLTCAFIVALIAFIIALVIRILIPTAGCEDPCFRAPPEDYTPMLSRRFQAAPEFDREVVASGREGLPTARWEPKVPREIRAGEFPYLGSVNSEDEAVCMTIIVSKKWCLTSATCYKMVDPKFPHLLMERDGKGVLVGMYRVKKAIIHKLYKPEVPENDIAALQPSTEFKLDDANHYRLPTKRNEQHMATGDMVILMGWGSKLVRDEEDERENVIRCWPVLLTWDRRLNTSLEVYDKAGVFVHGPTVLFIISRNKKTIKLSDYQLWLDGVVNGEID